MKGNYIFGNTLGKGMAKVSQRTQYEASLMSMVFILIGIVIMAIWTIFFTNFSIFIKIMTGINALAAWVFLSSMIITTFQQYQSYLQVMGIMNEHEEEHKGIPKDIKDTKYAFGENDYLVEKETE